MLFGGDFVSEGTGLKKCFAGNFRVRPVFVGPSLFCVVLAILLYVNIFLTLLFLFLSGFNYFFTTSAFSPC